MNSSLELFDILLNVECQTGVKYLALNFHEGSGAARATIAVLEVPYLEVKFVSRRKLRAFLRGVRIQPGEGLEFAAFIDEGCMPKLNEVEAEYFDFGSAYYFWKNRLAPSEDDRFTLFDGVGV